MCYRNENRSTMQPPKPDCSEHECNEVKRKAGAPKPTSTTIAFPIILNHIRDLRAYKQSAIETKIEALCSHLNLDCSGHECNEVKRKAGAPKPTSTTIAFLTILNHIRDLRVYKLTCNVSDSFERCSNKFSRTIALFF